MSKSIGSELCEALGLKHCVSVKLEVSSDMPFLMVTAVQYLDHNQFHPVDKVLRKYRLELISEQPLPTPEKEVFLGERVHTFRLPTHSPESDQQAAQLIKLSLKMAEDIAAIRTACEAATCCGLPVRVD